MVPPTQSNPENIWNTHIGGVVLVGGHSRQFWNPCQFRGTTTASGLETRTPPPPPPARQAPGVPRIGAH